MQLCRADNVVFVRFGEDATTYNTLMFDDVEAVMECSLMEDASIYEERISFDEGVAAVQHTLTLVADRNGAAAWLEQEFLHDGSDKGLCAVVTLNDGRQLLVGYSERFGAEQPLHIAEIVSTCGRSLADLPTITLTLTSFDTTASALYSAN